MKITHAILPVLLAAAFPSASHAQVTSTRLAQSASEPQNWLTYSGGYFGHRHSTLKQIDGANVKNLELKWVFQANSLQSFSATPLVVDNVMYVTQAPNDVVAIDAVTGKVFWVYHYAPSPGRLCCRGQVNRGVAIHGDTLFMATVDAHLVAIDAKNGKPIWKTRVGDASNAYGMTLAPLVVKDKVVVGVAGAEFGIRGYIAAYDVATGREAWRFYTIPGPGEPGHETWKGDAWQHDRHLRPRLEPHVLGHRQSGPRFQRRATAGRQPLLRQRRRAGRGHREAEVALPVHAQRSVRLRLHTGAGAGQRHLEGYAAEVDVLRESQRILLRPRSGDR
jgi:glucose dehydrogenase